MTFKIKLIFIAVALAAVGAAGFALRGCAVRRERAHAEAALNAQTAELARLEARLKIAETDLNASRRETKTLREKRTGRPLSSPPADCARCLAEVSLETEVRDAQRGWWIYRDRDVLDEEPGELTLTPRFWQEVIPPQPAATAVAPAATKPKRWKTEKEVGLGVNLTGYQAEFRYSPVIYSTRKWQAGMTLGSRLELDRLDQSLRGGLSAGLTLRW